MLFCRVVHFDLKSANILLGRDWTAKIADVGLAKILKDGWLSTLREVGSILPAWEISAIVSHSLCPGRRTRAGVREYFWKSLLNGHPHAHHCVLAESRVPLLNSSIAGDSLKCRGFVPLGRLTHLHKVCFLRKSMDWQGLPFCSTLNRS